MQKYIVTLDNGTDTVPPREEWRTVEAYDAKAACFDYSKTIQIQGDKPATFKVLVILLAQYEAHGWGGCICHTFDVKRTPIDKEQAGQAYDAQRQERVERYEDRATDARQESQQLGEQARRMADVIPFGQPILVGHHSERRDRNYRGRIDSKFRASWEAQEKAKHYEHKAAAAARNDSVYADDPNADNKLARKIEEAEKLQKAMTEINAAIRKHAKAGPEAQVAALVALGRSEAQARELLTPDFCKRIGFPSYALTNNAANIRRMKKRLQQVSANQALPAVEQEGTKARFEDCPAENRLRLWFPGKPAEDVRGRLKAAGYRWAPSLGCWQAFRTWRAEQAGKAEAGIVEAAA